MLYSLMMTGYSELKSMTRMNLSHNPRLGSRTRPPLYLSRLGFVCFFSPSSLNFDFLPHDLSGQIYFRRWNSCSKIYSFRSARPPLRVLFLFQSKRRRHRLRKTRLTRNYPQGWLTDESKGGFAPWRRVPSGNVRRAHNVERRSRVGQECRRYRLGRQQYRLGRYLGDRSSDEFYTSR